MNADSSAKVVYVDVEEEEESAVESVPAEHVPVVVKETSLVDAVSTLSITQQIDAVVDSVFDDTPRTQSLVSPSARTLSVIPPASVIAVPTVATFFHQRREPCPRINPCLTLRGNTLYVYGGVVEVGDVEVTLDDCWTLDLNKRDQWKLLLPGNMHLLVWKGEADDATEGTGDHSESGESDDDDEADDEEDEETALVKPSKSKGGSSGSGGHGKSSGLRAEMSSLRAELGDVQESIPVGKETLREFFARTGVYWNSEVIRVWQERGDGAALSEKEVKREAFKMAEVRYNELLPLLTRLNELEEQQSEMEGESKGSSASRSSSKRRSS